MDQRMMDVLAIKEVVENWAVWRDSGDWERFRTVWHADGVMMATWFQGPFEEFIRVNQEGWNRGVSILHLLCTGRFYDFFEKRDGRWAIVLRRLFYEKDRMDPVDPAATVKLDPAILEKFPEGYRHLCYLQSSLGFQVNRDMPGLRGAEAEALYAKGKEWLLGK